MSKHFSVFMLYIRSYIDPVIGVLFLLAAAQTGLFLLTMHNGAVSLQDAIQSAHLFHIWLAGLILLVILLFRRSEGGYILRRLRVSQRAVFWWHGLSCFLIFLLYWLAEVITVIALCRHFLIQTGSSVSDPTLFLVFYQSDFLHSILPLEEVSRWIYLLTTFLTLAFMMANDAMRCRYAGWQKPHSVVYLCVLVFSFQRQLGNMTSDILLTMLNLGLLGYAIWNAYRSAEEVAKDEAL